MSSLPSSNASAPAQRLIDRLREKAERHDQDIKEQLVPIIKYVTNMLETYASSRKKRFSWGDLDLKDGNDPRTRPLIAHFEKEGLTVSFDETFGGNNSTGLVFTW